MPSSISRSSVARTIAVASVGLAIVIGSVQYAIEKKTPTGVSEGTQIFQIKTSSGASGSSTGTTVFHIDELGNVTASGTFTTQANKSCNSLDTTSTGMIICGTDEGAGALTYAEAITYFVQDSGDTMTGSLTVHGTVSGSILSGKTLEVQQVNPTYLPFQTVLSGTALAVGSGTVAFTVPPALDGFNICDAVYQTDNAGITGTTDLQLYNITDGTHVYSTPFSIDSLENTSTTAATPGVINTSNDDVNTDEVLLFGVAEIHSGTAAQGLKGYIKFCLP